MKKGALLLLVVFINSCMAMEPKCSFSTLDKAKFLESKDVKISGVAGAEGDLHILYGLYKKPVNKKNSFVHIYNCKSGKLVKNKFFEFEIRKMHKVKKRRNAIEVIFADETSLVGDISWSKKENEFVFKAFVDEEL